jgi:nitroreductase
MGIVVGVAHMRCTAQSGDNVDVFDAMGTCRAMRYLRSEPVPDELIDKLIWAATRAPSPGNSQGWDFVIVKDPDKKRRIGDAIWSVFGSRWPDSFDDLPKSQARTMRGAYHLAKSLADSPVIILVCGEVIYPPGAESEAFVWSTAFPAAQNILVAARALGLGTVFTTFQNLAAPAIRDVLDIPSEVRMAAMIPVGWPDRPFGPVTREPIERFIHRDGWQGSRHSGEPGSR